jgi:hypothetical protein
MRLPQFLPSKKKVKSIQAVTVTDLPNRPLKEKSKAFPLISIEKLLFSAQASFK